MTARRHWSSRLPDEACDEAVAWAREQPSAAAAWRTCRRGDWLLWLLGRRARSLAERQRLVLVACDCAELALRYLPAGEARPAKCLRVTREWAAGRATLGQVRKARAAAAAAVANASYAAYAAYDAANASYAAYAAYAAYDAASAAAAANANASDAGAAAAARLRTLDHCARLVRARFPRPPRLP